MWEPANRREANARHDTAIMTPTSASEDTSGHKEARMSAGEAPIKQAIRWIDDQLHANPKADRLKLVDEASRRFDLSPADGDFLFRHLASKKT